MKICFICHANICRSYMAQEMLKKLVEESRPGHFEVFSRGVYAQSYYAVPQKVKDFLLKQDITPKEHFSTPVSKEDIENADLVLTMTRQQLNLLHDKFSPHCDKIKLFLDYAYDIENDMQDPISQTGRAFEKTALKIKEAVQLIYDKIKNTP